jgi:hypothetical protein
MDCEGTMPKTRRERQPKFLEEPFVDGKPDEPLFRHGQPPLHKQAYARIAELVATTPTEGVTYWNFKTLTEQVSRNIKA